MRSGRLLRTFERKLLHTDTEGRAIDGRQHINKHFLKTEAVYSPETVTIYQTAHGCNTEGQSVLEKSSEVHCGP